METSIFFIMLMAGGFFLWLAFLNFGREKYPTSTFLASVAALLIFCGFPWFQAFVKTWLVSNVNDKFKALGEQIDEVHSNTFEMQNHLAESQKTIADQQKTMAEQQRAIVDQQKWLSQLLSDVKIVQAQNKNQSTEISHVKENLTALSKTFTNLHLSLETTETIKGAETTKIYLLHKVGRKMELGVVFNSQPIPETLHGTVREKKGAPEQPLQINYWPIGNFFTVDCANVNLPNAVFTFQYMSQDLDRFKFKSEYKIDLFP